MSVSPVVVTRALWIAAAVVAVPVAGFLGLALRDGAFSDRCAEALVRDVTARDRAAVEARVRAPMMVEALFGAAQVELGFVRPESSASARVGLFVKATATATSARAMVLRLDTADRSSCQFVRDFEPGAFGF